jgi:hypothetical protein
MAFQIVDPSKPIDLAITDGDMLNLDIAVSGLPALPSKFTDFRVEPYDANITSAVTDTTWNYSFTANSDTFGSGVILNTDNTYLIFDIDASFTFTNNRVDRRTISFGYFELRLDKTGGYVLVGSDYTYFTHNFIEGRTYRVKTIMSPDGTYVTIEMYDEGVLFLTTKKFSFSIGSDDPVKIETTCQFPTNLVQGVDNFTSTFTMTINSLKTIDYKENVTYKVYKSNTLIKTFKSRLSNYTYSVKANTKDAGSYYLTAECGGVLVTSRTATIAVNNLPYHISVKPIGQNIVINDTINISTTAVGGTSSNYTFNLYKNNTLIDTVANTSGIYSYNKQNVQIGDTGDYYVAIINNGQTIKSDVIRYNVLPDLTFKILSQPKDFETFTDFNTILNFKVSGGFSPYYKFDTYRDNVLIKTEYNTTGDYNYMSLNNPTAGTFSYYIVATNNGATITSNTVHVIVNANTDNSNWVSTRRTFKDTAVRAGTDLILSGLTFCRSAGKYTEYRIPSNVRASRDLRKGKDNYYYLLAGQEYNSYYNATKAGKVYRSLDMQTWEVYIEEPESNAFIASCEDNLGNLYFTTQVLKNNINTACWTSIYKNNNKVFTIQSNGVGPNVGTDMTEIAYIESNNTIVAISNGRAAVYSKDNGVTWAVTGVVLPFNEKRVYQGKDYLLIVTEDGIYKTTDGITYYRKSYISSYAGNNYLAIGEVNGEIWCIPKPPSGSNDYLFVSYDKGETWYKRPYPKGITNAYVGGNTRFVQCNGVIYLNNLVSIDNGVTFFYNTYNYIPYYNISIVDNDVYIPTYNSNYAEGVSFFKLEDVYRPYITHRIENITENTVTLIESNELDYKLIIPNAQPHHSAVYIYGGDGYGRIQAEFQTPAKIKIRPKLEVLNTPPDRTLYKGYKLELPYRFSVDDSVTVTRYGTYDDPYTNYELGKYVKFKTNTWVLPINSTADVLYAEKDSTYFYTAGAWPEAGVFNACAASKKVAIALKENSDTFAYMDDDYQWYSDVLPVSAEWIDVAEHEELFIGIAKNSDVYVYGDGYSWTEGSLPLSLNWTSITYFKGKYIIVAEGSDKYLTSADGLSWTVNTLPATMNYMKIMNNSDVALLISKDSKSYLMSTDGIFWTTKTLPCGQNWALATYRNRFIIFAEEGLYYLDSLDGLTWIRQLVQKESIHDRNYKVVDFVDVGDDYFVFHRISTDNYFSKEAFIVESNIDTVIVLNGDEEVKYDDLSGDSMKYVVNSVNGSHAGAYKAGIYDYLTDEFIYSGITNVEILTDFVIIDHPDSATVNEHQNVPLTCEVRNGDLFNKTISSVPMTKNSYMTIAKTKNVLTILSSGGPQGVYSDNNGSTWTEINMPIGNPMNDTCSNDDITIAVADGSQYIYSTDGIVWTVGTLPFGASWKRCVYAFNKFFIFAKYSDKALWSSDGLNWTQFQLPTYSAWLSAIYVNGRLTIASSGSNYLAYTDDGINWNLVDLDPRIQISHIAYGNGRYVAAAYNTIDMFTSTDGLNWEMTEGMFTYPPNGIVFGDKFIIIEGNGNNTVHYSDDGITWSSDRVVSDYVTLKDIVFLGDRYLVSSSNSMIAYLKFSKYKFKFFESTDPVNPIFTTDTIDYAVTHNLLDVMEEDSGNYYVTVEANGEALTSNTANIVVRKIPDVVIPPLVITKHPVSISLTENEQFSLSVDYSGGVEPVTVDWYKDGHIIGVGNVYSKTAKLTDAGNYYAIVTDSSINIGLMVGVSLNSNVAVLDVKASKAPSTPYLNSCPPQSKEAPIYYPFEGIETATKIGQTFDYREPINVQATPAETSDAIYNKAGLYDASAAIFPKTPDYTEYFLSGNEDEGRVRNADGTPKIYHAKTYYNEKGEVTKTVSTISVLEKIRRIIDLKDARLIDFEYLQYFAEYLGWDMGVNLDSFSDSNLYSKKYASLMTPDEQQEAVMKNVRIFIENLPNWYRIKSTDSAVQIILFSFGLVADIIRYYTEDYSTDRNKWMTADTFYNTAYYQTKGNTRDETLEDYSLIPNNYYPTPHFSIRYSINDSFTAYTGLFYDEGRFKTLIAAIDAVKPITTVFEGLVGLLKTEHEYITTIYSVATSFTASVTTTGKLENDELSHDPDTNKWVVLPVSNETV